MNIGVILLIKIKKIKKIKEYMGNFIFLLKMNLRLLGHKVGFLFHNLFEIAPRVVWGRLGSMVFCVRDFHGVGLWKTIRSKWGCGGGVLKRC